MPNPDPLELDKAHKKDFDITFTLDKKYNGYIIRIDEKFYFELLNVITGGGTNYLIEFNKEHGIE